MDLCPDEIRHNKIIQHQQDLIQNTTVLETEIENIAETLKEPKLINWSNVLVHQSMEILFGYGFKNQRMGQ